MNREKVSIRATEDYGKSTWDCEAVEEGTG